MARKPRLIVPELPHYIHQSGHHKQNVFQDIDDHHYFLKLLEEGAQKFFVQIYAYALLMSDVHLLAIPKEEDSLAKMMQWIGRHYVPYFNLKYGHSGTIWEGRFKTAIVDPACQMECGQYIELLPVFARETLTAEASRWTSYSHHTGARHDALMHIDSQYWALGNTPFERELNYKKSVESLSVSKMIKEIAHALEKSGILGKVSFIQKLEQELGLSFSPKKRGRPSKQN